MSSLQHSPLHPGAHPYFAADADIPNYIPNERSLLSLLSIFTAAALLLILTTTLLSLYSNPKISRSNLLTTLWFTISGAIHLFFESHYILHPSTLASSQTIRAQLWKEYALSDSRYLTVDPLVLSMETYTVVFWGPLSLLTAACIIRNNPWRWPLQMMVSVAHLYGDAIYYATSGVAYWVYGIEYCRPEGVYFWGYFVGMNAFWIVVPGWLIWKSATEIVEAFRQLDRLQKTKVD